MILDVINEHISWLTIFLILFCCHMFGLQLIFFLLLLITSYISFSRYHILGFIALFSLNLFGTFGFILLKVFILLTLFVYNFDKIKNMYEMTKCMLATAVNVNNFVKSDGDTSEFIVKLNNKIVFVDRLNNYRLKIVNNVNDSLNRLKTDMLTLSLTKDIVGSYGYIEANVSKYTNFVFELIYKNLVLIFDFYPLIHVKNWVYGYYLAYVHISSKERDNLFRDDEDSVIKINEIPNVCETANMFKSMMANFDEIKRFDTQIFNDLLSSTLCENRNKRKKIVNQDNYKSTIENMLKGISEKKITIKKKEHRGKRR